MRYNIDYFILFEYMNSDQKIASEEICIQYRYTLNQNFTGNFVKKFEILIIFQLDIQYVRKVPAQ